MLYHSHGVDCTLVRKTNISETENDKTLIPHLTYTSSTGWLRASAPQGQLGVQTHGFQRRMWYWDLCWNRGGFCQLCSTTWLHPFKALRSSEGLGKRSRELDKLAIVLTVRLPTATQAPRAMLRAAWPKSFLPEGTTTVLQSPHVERSGWCLINSPSCLFAILLDLDIKEKDAESFEGHPSREDCVLPLGCLSLASNPLFHAVLVFTPWRSLFLFPSLVIPQGRLRDVLFLGAK